VDDDIGSDTGLGAAGPDAQLDALIRAARGPLNWLLVEQKDAPAAWHEMRDWVEWFRAEFSFDHRVVPPCWYLHPALVNLLSAVRDHWYAAYDPVGPPAGASDWHRALVQLEPRLREWAARTGCTVSMHRPDVAVVYPEDDGTWAAHLMADAENRAQALALPADGAGS
jgi:hypothetical protein